MSRCRLRGSPPVVCRRWLVFSPVGCQSYILLARMPTSCCLGCGWVVIRVSAP